MARVTNARQRKGEIYTGATVMGIQYKVIVGGSVGSAHWGFKGGGYYESHSGNVVFEGIEHLGFIVGEKAGVQLIIPAKPLWDWFWE